MPRFGGEAIDSQVWSVESFPPKRLIQYFQRILVWTPPKLAHWHDWLRSFRIRGKAREWGSLLRD